MKLSHLASVVVLLLPTSAASRPISVAEINQRSVLGDLGKPLGTIVAIEGTMVAEAKRSTPPSKEDSDGPFLRIERVDGNTLPRPVYHRFAAGRVQRPQLGRRFQLVGYETGGFRGIVDGAFAYTEATSGHSYQLKLDFVVLAAGKKKSRR